jgi:hypothetical protein
MRQEQEQSSPDEAEVQRVSGQAAGRLGTLGIWLGGQETPEELTAMQEAVERFEDAVQAHGGDLMVDEPPPGRRPQPDDPDFALPIRRKHEAVEHYLERLNRAAQTVQRHRDDTGAAG